MKLSNEICFIICSLYQILLDGGAKKDEMGATYSTQGEMGNAYKI
jgi:hypothetical protein